MYAEHVFPFLSSNIPSSPAYGVFISQLIRYARACSSYECFILRAARLSSKLLRQGICHGTVEIVPQKVLWSIWGSHQTLWSLPLPNVTWHSGTWPYTMTPSIDMTLHQFAKLLPNWTLIPILTLLPNFGGFHRTLQRVRLANRGRLLLRTPGPVPFGTWFCSNVETILSWTCHVYGPFEFRTSLGTSILLLILLFKIMRKRKRSDSVLWQNPLHQHKCQKRKVTTQKTPQKRLHSGYGPTDLGQSVGVTTATKTGVVNLVYGPNLPTPRNSRVIKMTHV